MRSSTFSPLPADGDAAAWLEAGAELEALASFELLLLLPQADNRIAKVSIDTAALFVFNMNLTLLEVNCTFIVEEAGNDRHKQK
ncbi:MAG: hypothetical protein J7559_14340, partial [Cohnella sp.]|nr:hypothetical protein [Cohnella sp.]